MKNKFRIITLFIASLPLTGCLDAGLKYQAESSRKKNPPTEQPTDESLMDILRPDTDPEPIVGGNQPNDPTSAPPLPSSEDIQKLLELMKEDMEKKAEDAKQDQPATSPSPSADPSPSALASVDLQGCSSVNIENCDESENAPVCAQISATIGAQKSVAQFEFKNACLVCKNSTQQKAGNSLEVLGFKSGSCEQK